MKTPVVISLFEKTEKTEIDKINRKYEEPNGNFRTKNTETKV